MNRFTKITFVIILGLLLIGLHFANKASRVNSTSKQVELKVRSDDETPTDIEQRVANDKTVEIPRYRTTRIVPKGYKGKVTRLLIREQITDTDKDSVYIYKLNDESTGASYFLGNAHLLEMAVAAEPENRTLQNGVEYRAEYMDKSAIFVPRKMADDEEPEKLVWGVKPDNSRPLPPKQMVKLSGFSQYKNLTLFAATKNRYKSAGEISVDGDVSLDSEGKNICELGVYKRSENGSSVLWLCKGDWPGNGNINFRDLKNELSGKTRTFEITGMKQGSTYELSFVVDVNDVLPVYADILKGDSKKQVELPTETKFYGVVSQDGKVNYLPLIDKIDLQE